MRADFGEDNLDFHEQAAQCLEYKHELARLVAHSCPDIMPLTFGINDQNWPQVLGNIADSFYRQGSGYCDRKDALSWILKPSMLNNGQYIKLFNSLSALERHFSSAQRMGGEHVIQQYISSPHLLRDDRKYSIRLFLVLTNDSGAFLYPQGYFNVALHPFLAEDFQDLRSHLTNEHLQGDLPNVLQIPSNRFGFFPALYSQIKELSGKLIAALRARYPQAFERGKQAGMALFGVDFMVDNRGQVWLLEVNHGPCFPVTDEHPLQACLYRDFWRAVLGCFVIPMAEGGHECVDRSAFFDRL